MSAEPYKATKKQIKCFWADELDPATAEEQVLVAESFDGRVDSQTLNLYELLKTKMPGLDVENDPDARLQYEYYLQRCSAYYAEKLRPKYQAMDEIYHARNVNACQERLRDIRFDRLADVPDDPDELVWSDEEAIAGVEPVSALQSSASSFQVSAEVESQIPPMPDSPTPQSADPIMLLANNDDDEDDEDSEILPLMPDSENMIDDSVVDLDEEDDDLDSETDSVVVDPLNVSQSRGGILSDASSLTYNESVRIDSEEMSAPNATSTQRNTNN